MTAFFSWLARSAVRYPWWFIGAWCVIVGLAAVAAGRTGQVLIVGGFSLPGTEFHAASEILARDLKLASDKSAVVVFHSDRHLVTDKVFADAVEASLAKLRQDAAVIAMDSFYKTGLPDVVSPDNRTTYGLLRLQGTEKELEEATPRLRQLARVPDRDFTVYLIGQPMANYDVEIASAEDLVHIEMVTFPIVFLILLIVFESLVAAGLPLIMGLASVILTLALLYLLALVSNVSIFALNTSTMIGLGLAINFSLILVSRFREELVRQPLPQALDATLQTAGRSITFSGITLMLTMAVLTLFPVMVIHSIALAITIVAFVAILTGLFLLPALLAVLGPYLNSLSIRWLLPWSGRDRQGGWHRWSLAVMRRPWISMLSALVLLGLMALPALWIRLSGVTAEVLPKTAESRLGVELVQRQFGMGEAAPLLVAIEANEDGGLWKPDIMEGVLELHTKLENNSRVAHVQSLASLIPNPTSQWMQSLSPVTISINPDRRRFVDSLTDMAQEPSRNRTTVLVVYPTHPETDPKTIELLQQIRTYAKTWAPGLKGARVLVGGAAAQHYDFNKVVYDQFPLLLGMSLFVTFIILVVFFHSLLLPIKAILLNLASLAASYGLLVVVFQYGYGDWLLGFHSLGAVLSYTPVLLFSILFGLSTDYEVFLLTRVREYVRQGHSNEEAVALGLEHTAGIITAAGLIMMAIFGSFAFARVLVIKELGFALAVAVLLDITLVRIILVPASMKLMGDWNWWMPRVLDHVVPEIDEGEPASPPAVLPDRPPLVSQTAPVSPST